MGPGFYKLETIRRERRIMLRGIMDEILLGQRNRSCRQQRSRFDR